MGLRRTDGHDDSTAPARRSLSGGVFPCFDYPTLASELDAHSLSWRYYAPVVGGGDFGGLVWSAFDAIHQVRYGADWNDVVSPETRVLSDVQHGQLASVTWIVPDLANSDHASSDSSTGQTGWHRSSTPSARARFGRVLRSSSSGTTGAAGTTTSPPQLDAAGLGIRVPLLVVSPYAKRNYVSHEQLETASILKFAEYTFGLKALSAADGRASLPDDFFDFTRPPRTFVPLSTRRRPLTFRESYRRSVHPTTDGDSDGTCALWLSSFGPVLRLELRDPTCLAIRRTAERRNGDRSLQFRAIANAIVGCDARTAVRAAEGTAGIVARATTARRSCRKGLRSKYTLVG